MGKITKRVCTGDQTLPSGGHESVKGLARETRYSQWLSGSAIAPPPICVSSILYLQFLLLRHNKNVCTSLFYLSPLGKLSQRRRLKHRSRAELRLPRLNVFVSRSARSVFFFFFFFVQSFHVGDCTSSCIAIGTCGFLHFR